MEQATNPVVTVHNESYFKDYLTKSGCTFIKTDQSVDRPKTDKEKLKKIFGDKADIIETILIPIINSYLQKFIITDSFQDHHERRDWRQSLPSEVRKYYEDNNKIRGNNVTCVLGAISLLPENTEDLEFKKQFEEEYKKLGVESEDQSKRFEYGALTLEEKIEFAHKLDHASLKVLEIIG